MGYTEEAQTIPHRKFDVFTPQYGGHLKDIRWRHEFEDTFGIVDYTRIFINIHEQRGVVLTRHAVELSWVQQVARMFGDDGEKKEFMVLQVGGIAIFASSRPHISCCAGYTSGSLWRYPFWTKDGFGSCHNEYVTDWRCMEVEIAPHQTMGSIGPSERVEKVSTVEGGC